MSRYETTLVALHGGVTLVHISLPDTLNAPSSGVWTGLPIALTFLEKRSAQ